MNRGKLAMAALIAIIAAGAGYIAGHRLRGGPTAVRAEALPQLLATRFADVTGQYRTLAEGKGQIQVVNYWATWCPPCRHEMPELSRLAQDYQSAGVRVIGIAVDEMPAVARYLAAAPVSYPIWLGDPMSMGLTASLGNGGQVLPFTLLLDREGRIAYVKTGLISDAELRREIDKLLPRP